MNPENELRILSAEIQADLGLAAEICGAIGRVLASIADSAPGEVEIAALGSFLHGFYTAVEAVLVRIEKTVDATVPTGELWHREVLARASLAVEGVRPEILGSETTEKLREYLAFRHFFRHSYAPRLRWEKMSEKAKHAAAVFGLVRADIDRFLDLLLAKG